MSHVFLGTLSHLPKEGDASLPVAFAQLRVSSTPFVSGRAPKMSTEKEPIFDFMYSIEDEDGWRWRKGYDEKLYAFKLMSKALWLSWPTSLWNEWLPGQPHESRAATLRFCIWTSRCTAVSSLTFRRSERNFLSRRSSLLTWLQMTREKWCSASIR